MRSCPNPSTRPQIPKSPIQLTQKIGCSLFHGSTDSATATAAQRTSARRPVPIARLPT
ncbi:hypothetical protein LINGRAPRIM_LOCUS1790 [Linum grandiflorum]